MNPMIDSFCSPALQRLVAVLGLAVALAGCSRDLSAQSGHSTAAAPAATGATQVSDPGSTPCVKGK